MGLKMAAAAAGRVLATTLKSPNFLLHHTFFIRTQRFIHSPFYQILPPNRNHHNLPLNMSSQSTSSPVPPPDSSSTPIQTVRVMIKGRVQGVFYRDWTVENAKELGLKGWVRNRRDGSVEALFSGNSDKVGEMQERCRRGPPSAMVTGLDVNPSTEDPGTGFERRSTV